jgi:hypothetical protein
MTPKKHEMPRSGARRARMHMNSRLARIKASAILEMMPAMYERESSMDSQIKICASTLVSYSFKRQEPFSEHL